MAVGKVDMWNLALAELGGADKGEVIDDDSNTELKAVRWLGYVWEQCLDYVASLDEWDQLKTYQDLSAHVDSVERGNWDYAYPVPAITARWIRLTDEDNHDLELKHSKEGLYILTNETEPYGYFIRKIVESDFGRLDPGLRQAIIKYTAAMIAPPMVGGEEGRALKSVLLSEFYRLDFPYAQGFNMQDDYEEKVRLWTYTGGGSQNVDRVVILK